MADDNGESVELLAESCSMTLFHHIKLTKSLKSAIWKNGKNPVLIFASGRGASMCGMSVKD